jgi:hypothetical protein
MKAKIELAGHEIVECQAVDFLFNVAKGTKAKGSMVSFKRQAWVVIPHRPAVGKKFAESNAYNGVVKMSN